MNNEKKNYYLAYGSNLNISQMKRRCPDSIKVGSAVLKDYRLLFKGDKNRSFLTIEKSVGSSLPLGVWEVSDSDIGYLDMYEGYPIFYYKKEIEIEYLDANGQINRVSAFIYIMNEERKIGMPTDFYFQTCLEGYEDFGFDRKYLDKALQVSLNSK